MDLIVTVEDVARRLGLPQPLDVNDAWLLQQAITDAQSDLEAYLGRPATPRTYTETGLYPYATGYRLTHTPLLTITTQTAETDSHGDPTGYYTVTYTAGLDGANDPDLEPLRRFVRTHAAYSPALEAMLARLLPGQTRVLASASVEGQSVTYTASYQSGLEPGSGAPGSLPTLASCDRWRLRSVFQRRTTPIGPWPFECQPSPWRDW